MHHPSTRRSNRVGWFRPPMGGGRVGRSHRSKNTVKKTQIRQRNPDSGNSFPIFDDISLRYIEISPDLVRFWRKYHRIWWDIARSIQNLTGSKRNITGIWVLRRILENYRWKMDILAEVWKYFGWFRFFRFWGRKTETDLPESVSGSEDPPKPSSRPDSSLIRSVLRVGRVTGSIWTALVIGLRCKTKYIMML